jgi:hypothetical protein
MDCGCEWEEETTSWAQQDAATTQRLSDEQIADLGTETDPRMIPCGCSEATLVPKETLEA